MKTSKREIARRYKALLVDVETNVFYKVDLIKRVNCYVCKCGEVTKTRDVDAGVTSMVVSCPECKGNAMSSFYKDIAPDQNPTHEWYRPDLEKVLKLSEWELDHVLQGGLMFRKIFTGYPA